MIDAFTMVTIHYREQESGGLVGVPYTDCRDIEGKTRADFVEVARAIFNRALTSYEWQNMGL